MSSARAFLLSLETLGIKLGLEQVRALLAALGHPDRAFRSIVVAGTNGKGSVTAMVERALRADGYRTGRYTSPHLVALEERFAIDGVPISADELDRTAARVQSASACLPAPPSFFEATTALGLEVFRDRQIDIAVLEVGLGGRLDATNAVTPVAVAITSIDFDHEQYLGDTIESIAREKAGIIKPGALVVLAPNPAEVEQVVTEVCARQGAVLIRAESNENVHVEMAEGRASLSLRTPRAHYSGLVLGLRGRHQVGNAVTAIRLLEALADVGMPVSTTAVRTGIEQVEWPGRLELLQTRLGSVLIDGAHNPAGAAALASYLDDTYGRPLPLVVGVMADKNIDRILNALAPAASHFVFTAVASDRAARPHDLASRAGIVCPGVPCVGIVSPLQAVRHAHTLGDPVVVAGSLYLAGEVRARISEG
jgi:dihydrofolate synthase/folylpolyglutamate synthase